MGINISSFAAASAIVLFSVLGMSLSWASPTDKKADGGLDTHGTINGASELAARAYAVCEKADALVSQLDSMKDNPDKWSGKAISDMSGQLFQADRDAKHLTLMGEPAGADLAIQVSLLTKYLHDFAVAIRSTRQGQKLRQEFDVKLTRAKPKLQKFIEKAQGFFQAENYETFNKGMEAKGVELTSQLAFFTSKEAERYVLNYYSVLSQGTTKVSDVRRDQYVAQAKKAASVQAVPASEFASQARRVVSEIGTSAKAALADGAIGDASEAMAYLVSKWESASAGLIRASAIDFAFRLSDGSQIDGEMSQLKSDAQQAIVQLIDAAASSAQASSVRTLHAKMIDQISVVHRRMGNGSGQWVAECDAALIKLASKEAGFAEQVAAYRRATAEPLSWRQLFSAQQSKQVQATVKTATGLMAEKTEVQSSLRPSYHRSVPGPKTIAPTRLAEPSSWIMDEAGARLMGQRVFEPMARRLSPTSKVGMVPYAGNHYAAVALPVAADEQASDLKASLAIAGSQPPLTIEAADAISRSVLGDYEGFVAEVKGVTMESPITRFITLPDLAYLLVPLGELPDLENQSQAMQEICWRLDLQPLWADAKNFTVKSQ
ncbi:hypothetical protein [Rubripirellula reticaptiva]|uniref:Uncharacterized protein n=1 Tax=Rubripirellula reticaptiva TaxID=2528013 RepID=A0A5C6FDG1_9BACT|nr:hypothetical protein [Rubripirellula reticaptiva]TWU58284.1 hypothetical protein Poly59_11950 [Rubripirellula reticaptiva]